MARSKLTSVAVVMAAVVVLLLPAADLVTATSFFPEDPCSREGGVCGLVSACPVEKRHPTKGLCPRQQDQGVECCWAVPSNTADCMLRGGECFPAGDCRGLKDPVGLCEEGEVCCVLV